MEEIAKPDRNAVISGRVTHSGGKGIIRHADVRLVRIVETNGERVEVEADKASSDGEGKFSFTGNYEAGEYRVRCKAFGKTAEKHLTIHPDRAIAETFHFDLPLGVTVTTHMYKADRSAVVPVIRGVAGKGFILRTESAVEDEVGAYRWHSAGSATVLGYGNEGEHVFHEPGIHRVEAIMLAKTPGGDGKQPEAVIVTAVEVSEGDQQNIRGHVDVTLNRSRTVSTLDQALWFAIRDRTHAISFHRYKEFVDGLLGPQSREAVFAAVQDRMAERERAFATHLHGVAAYQVLKFVTEMFLMANCGVRISSSHEDKRQELERVGQVVSRRELESRLEEYLGSARQLPYLRRVIDTAFPWIEQELQHRDRVLTADRITAPCLLELIHEYWLEEGMLMQTMNAITRRFQNIHNGDGRDPLATFELDPIRPLNNLLFGYVEKESDRLSVRRRAFEYIHQYGLPLLGKALADMRAADSRSRFVEAFHKLLHQAMVFYSEDCQTTVIAEGYRLLNALKEVHLILAEGAHNQFGDVPWAARVETLMTEYILARPEIRDFLQSRVMVPVKEAWIPQVDAMKTLQGWTDVSATYFRDLAVYGEQLLLSIRYADWIGVSDEDPAKNWARFWKSEVIGYLHAYQAVTGVDLAGTADTTPPAFLLQRRVAQRLRA
ncbi:MAG TPA: carboxypeptidase-like regulatory domain-containing protein [Bryobacteraceae bacterium]|jgi:hypothetical protein|nr:carboxypeptidase-like regulatory domain-containing protein [Bryobacteraceae bacterium]